MHYYMHMQVALTPEPILLTLQQHGVHLLTRLLSLGRTPEPPRVPQPVRPDAPGSRSRPCRSWPETRAT